MLVLDYLLVYCEMFVKKGSVIFHLRTVFLAFDKFYLFLFVIHSRIVFSSCSQRHKTFAAPPGRGKFPST